MIDVIDAWLRLAADRIHEQAAALTALDQAIGDGDHGTNMDRGFAAIGALLDAGRPEGDGPQAVAVSLNDRVVSLHAVRAKLVRVVNL